MADSYLSFGIDPSGKRVELELRNGQSFIKGTNTRPAPGTTIQTAGGIFQMGTDYKGVLVQSHNAVSMVANKNMIPVEDKPQNGAITTVDQKQQVNTVITPQGGSAANYPAPVASAGELPDIVYIPNGTGGYDAQQNTVASLGIDNSTLVLGGVLLGGIVLLKKFLG